MPDALLFAALGVYCWCVIRELWSIGYRAEAVALFVFGALVCDGMVLYYLTR